MEIPKIQLTREQSIILAVAILVLCAVGFVLNLSRIKGREYRAQDIIDAQSQKGPITEVVQEGM